MQSISDSLIKCIMLSANIESLLKLLFGVSRSRMEGRYVQTEPQDDRNIRSAAFETA